MRENIFFHFFRRFYASFDARAGQLYTIIMTLHISVALVEKNKKNQKSRGPRCISARSEGFFFQIRGRARGGWDDDALHFWRHYSRCTISSSATTIVAVIIKLSYQIPHFTSSSSSSIPMLSYLDRYHNDDVVLNSSHIQPTD